MKTLFERFLNVEKFSDFKDSISEEQQKYIMDTDPSGRMKYADWIYKFIFQSIQQPPPVGELKETLSILFNKIKGEMSDINMYESYQELHQATKKLQMESKSRIPLSSGMVDVGGAPVKYKLFIINNRYGAVKSYHDPITSWCIATNYPHHYKRETADNTMMFVVAETDQPRPRNFLALRLANPGVDITRKTLKPAYRYCSPHGIMKKTTIPVRIQWLMP